MAKVENQIDKAKKDFDSFDSEVKTLTMDRMNLAPKEEQEPLVKLSQKDIEASKDIYLKPFRSVNSREKFNEKFRSDYEFATENVRFTAEHREIIGEDIEIWTKPFPGMPAQEWKVPVGKPVWGPRHLAEQIASRKYHRLSMQQDQVVGVDGHGKYFGSMVVDKTIQRLDALPVSTSKSIFMGASGF